MTAITMITTVEHADRSPRSKDEIAASVAADIPTGSYVNLGIGQPTTVANYLTPGSRVILHTENGMLNMGRQAVGDEIDPDLINAGKIPVIELRGRVEIDLQRIED
jgi:3-oxoadipate CoA-transferase beta subunit